MKPQQKIIIDTDPGQDDAMALMLACKSVELNILAVTTVAGNSTIENTTRNACFILEFLRRSDIPVYSGATKPLCRPLRQAVIHGKSGLEGVKPTNESKLTGNAVDKILEIIAANPNEITLVALGPMTNIAQAIQRQPKIMKKVKAIVCMGGAIAVPGNMNRVAEFNVFVDPEAANIVMNFPVPKVLVPLDVCNQVQMQLSDIEEINDAPLRKLLRKMLVPYINNLVKDAGVQGALMYDPLTVFYLLQPQDCTVQEMNVQIETCGQLTRGMTVADRRKVTDGTAPNVGVVTKIDPEVFIARFKQALNTL